MSESEWQPYADEGGGEGFAIDVGAERVEVLRLPSSGHVMVYARDDDGGETAVCLTPEQWEAMRRLDLFGKGGGGDA